MNPFSRFLPQRLRNRSLADFAVRWQTFEALAIRLFRQKEATAADLETDR
jgi:hypothetical protein